MRAYQERTLQTDDDDPSAAVPASVVQIHPFEDLRGVDRAMFDQLVRSRQVAVSADGAVAAEVVLRDQASRVIHPAVGLSAPFERALVVDVTASRVRAFAQRGRQSGLFDLTAEGAKFVTPLREYVGTVHTKAGPVVHGIEDDGETAKRRFILPSGEAHDEIVALDRSTGKWTPVETQINPLADGRVLCVRQLADGFERVVFGDGDRFEKLMLPAVRSVRSLPLGDGYVDFLNLGPPEPGKPAEYDINPPPGFRKPCKGPVKGTVTLAWSFPDRKSVLVLETASPKHDERGAKSRLLRMWEDGTMDTVEAPDRFCMKAHDVRFSESGNEFVARVRPTDQDKGGPESLVSMYASPVTLPRGTKLGEMAVGDDGMLRAYVADGPDGMHVQAGRDRYAVSLYAWNLHLEGGKVVFNEVDEKAILRVALE